MTSDMSLKKLVEEELDWEPSIDAADIGVTVEDGIIGLSGHVATYAQKIRAEEVTKRVKGVRGVAQNLEVRPFQGAGASDEEIARRAANSLEWDTMVPAGKVTVSVAKGVLTLTGEVDWQYQRIAAEQAVHGLYGVRSVVNLVAIKPRVTSADIKQRIEDALKRQAQADADRIRVIVDGDKVKLEGKVKAWFERSAAERAAWSAPGVKTVEDKVVIGT